MLGACSCTAFLCAAAGAVARGIIPARASVETMAAAGCSAGGVGPPALLVSLGVRPPTLLSAA